VRCRFVRQEAVGINNQFRVFYNSLPEETVLPYNSNFRCGPHNRQLINKTSRLADASFIVRVLYKDIY